MKRLALTLSALLVGCLASGQEPGGCRTIKRVAVEPYSEVMKWIINMISQDHDVRWGLSFKDPPGKGEVARSLPPRTAANSKDYYIIQAGPRVFEIAGNEANNAACVLAHELAHIVGDHYEKRQALWDAELRRWEAAHDRQERRAMIAESYGPCSESRPGRRKGQNECEMLEEGLFQDYVGWEVPSYIKMRQDQELEADVFSMQFVQRGGLDPWACYLLRRSLPDPPPPDRAKGDTRYFHQPAAVSAEAMRQELMSERYLPLWSPACK